MSNEIAKVKDYGAVLEKVIINNDLGALSSVEKVEHIKRVCESIGLNPLTKPIQLIKFQGKEVMYFTREATDQLRKIHNVSIAKLEKEFTANNDTYIVTAYAETPDGRKDASTGAINLKGLIGDALCNALMKAESKAKRRATLSICGLGFAMDESETDTLPNPKVVDLDQDQFLDQAHDTFIADLESCITTEQLKKVFDEIRTFDWKGRKNLLDDLIRKKDEIKLNIQHAASSATE